VESVNFEALIDHSKKLKDPFINIEQNEKGCYKNLSLCSDSILKELKQNKIHPDKTMNELTIDEQKIIKEFITEKILKHQNKPSIGKFVEHKICPCCQGTRLNDKGNAVKLHELSISDMLALTVDELYDLFSHKTVHHKKMIEILKALKTATLGYLSLNRTTDTLSGGELQRVKFSLELTGDYTNLLYILDEPSTGLHPYNNAQMIHLIKQLRDKGNTVILSEHNADYIEASDHVIELGYGSGHLGGEIIYQGVPHPKQKTDLIRTILKPNMERTLTLLGVSSNNINNENFIIPLNVLVVITGVSGSGKSSLIHQVLVPTLKQYLADKTYNQQMVKYIEGLEHISSLIELTQSQIGINSRSIVATYLDIFDKIRDLFALCEHAKELELDKGDFSFNSSGACDTCKGLGETEEGTLCPSCLGTRYKPEITDIKLNGLSVAELLTKNISELSRFFSDEKLIFAVQMMERLGLSHLSLGRTTPTLSGGEAQRLKLAKSLIESFNKIKKGSFLFILDEPTSGLNVKDTNKIFSIFDEILSYGNSIIVIEHNQHIIKNGDYVIDMGIGSGYAGGNNIFSGMVCDLIKHPTSLTAKALRGEKELFEHNAIDTSLLKEKIFSSNHKPDCHPFYLNESHFQVEKNYAEHYHVMSDNDRFLYFKNKESLIGFYEENNFERVLFNPYVAELYKHKIVPISIKKKKIKALKKLNMPVSPKDYEVPEWDYRVECDNVNKAYSFGNGWITVYKDNEKYELFTRFVSIEHKMIGSPVVNEMTFNLYLNACHYCHGLAKKEVYDLNLIIADDTKSILEDGFLHSGIKKFTLKTIITKFVQEGLFDFSIPFNQLSESNKHIFLFGFEPYKFLKPNGKVTTLGDYIEWKGLYYYIYEQLDDGTTSKAIKTSQHSEACPFCCHGFNNEIVYYRIDGKNIAEIMLQGAEFRLIE
jgi:excinuclease ABC subunit A